MSVHLQKEIERLKKQILGLSALVEENVKIAAKALTDRDGDLAAKAIENDLEVDEKEVEVEEECLKILALHQPVAIDLRYVIAILKINNDLERIGDLAVNVARKAQRAAGAGTLPIHLDFSEMAGKTQSMLRRALDCLVNMDGDLAREVCASDDEVDEMKSVMNGQLMEKIQEDSERVQILYTLMGAVRNLERIADLATNIAEDVIYMIEGEIVRHRVDEM